VQTQSNEPRKTPNQILKAIREQERHQSREEFARAFREKAEEMGEKHVACDARLVARWERGDIRCPHPITRRILSALLERPFEELGFSCPPQANRASSAENGQPISQ
jgi:hypothetical protein